ncbi:hypothetical protein E6P09_18690 (plasmid) [Haloferax mediterranei ATCC 33500]|uniref:DUF7847 domain-containing protein n=1 Tax=Haloferax mediterranei (strain ATCC 33500 / DSM 1411 / JCM 8866 / NBRC 14739 / NCIMB 2177 / R-4) TaxID=523841 RepID=I3R9J8_HALMT|nr:hypothetical protein [Haloferax mediterranei]AFK20908.1 hypothetical protein HFX_5073 [Haloferax mediterranei ATCC 33500]AHZ24222.1 hypothetical protein BM92_18645 [Haloferax mediterranei ATCC 33500]EMA05301.1 hypothetical protein C439_00840 [Haloferax mediterranei ATCC 33500]MDX5989897.1 hypothetical protein [Haloferax mediterranei ATCC 33500]QCQ77338.1 hypothetical protein E6P09_18690 [Haloferax mediterranei ATCC 33500]
MAVGKALQSVPSALARNPLIVALFGLFGLIQSVTVVTQQINPLVGLAVSGVFFLGILVGMPFIHGGLIKMADEALRGTTSLSTFISAGKQNYVSLLGAMFVVFGVNMALGIVLWIIVIMGVGVGMAVGEHTGLIIAGLIGLVIGLVYFVFVFFIQFYSQEIVLNDASAIDSLKQSAALVRKHLLSTFGYMLISAVGGGLVGGAIGAAGPLLLPAPSPTLDSQPLTQELLLGMGGYLVIVVLAIAVLGSILTVFSVAFYREIRTGRRGGQPMNA